VVIVSATFARAWDALSARGHRNSGVLSTKMNPPPEPEHPNYLMISLAQVSKRFNGKREVIALDGVDLEIAQGEMVSIVGPSGSGKSTLSNLIGGLDRPS